MKIINLFKRKKEMVNSPSHYNKEGRKECIYEMIDIFGHEAVVMWAIITAYKYRYRLGEKDAVEQELGKIKWYEDFALNHIGNCSQRTQAIYETYHLYKDR